MLYNYFFIIIGLIVFFYLFYKFPLLEEESEEREEKTPEHSISIIIPVRNEELNLPNILADLKKQNYNIHEIICVDDGSTDSSANIIKESGAKYLNIETLPSHWKGKTWACQNGALSATGDLLLFIDSDVRFSQSAVKHLVNHYDRCKNPISVQPYHIVTKKHEYFSLFFNLIQICVTSLSIFHSKKHVGFYGPVLLIPRKLFIDHGGYEAVKNSVIEDFNLGKYYNSINVVIDLILGGKEIKFSMYPTSISQVIEGWSKNFSSGAISIKFSLFVLVFFWIAYLTALPIELMRSLILKNSISSVILIIIYIISVFKINSSIKKIGSYPLYVSCIYPIYLLAFHLIFFYSLLGTYVFKSTKWKGRNMKGN